MGIGRVIRCNVRGNVGGLFGSRCSRKEEMEAFGMTEIVIECETCQGKGEVFQESGAGIHATANMGWVECPDCEGDGVIS